MSFGLVPAIGGTLLLLAIIAITVWSRRGRGRRRTELATRDLYRKLDREAKDRSEQDEIAPGD